MPADSRSLFGDDEALARFRVHVCLGPNCRQRGSARTLARLEESVRERGLDAEIDIVATSCRDRCDFGPSVNVFPGPVFYAHVTEQAVDEILERHLIAGDPVERFRFQGKAGSGRRR